MAILNIFFINIGINIATCQITLCLVSLRVSPHPDDLPTNSIHIYSKYVKYFSEPPEYQMQWTVYHITIYTVLYNTLFVLQVSGINFHRHGLQSNAEQPVRQYNSTGAAVSVDATTNNS